MNHYFTSNGERVSRKTIDRKIRKAKAEKLEQQRYICGYNYCEDCQRNDCRPLDSSHDIPVSECLNTRRAELAWDTDNITIRGRKCHRKYDKNFIGTN